MLQHLPKIDELIGFLEKKNIRAKASHDIVRDVCRDAVQKMRETILAANDKELSRISVEHAAVVGSVEAAIEDLHRYRLRRIVNATGVILHTNLGRAPLCSEAVERIADVGRGYSNLEFNLEKGERGFLTVSFHRGRRLVGGRRW